MLKLLHISDLHFGPYYLAPVGEAVLRMAQALAPDAVVVSGDLTQRARRRQFEEARAFLDRLPAGARIVVPGNHDVPLYRVHERLLRPYALYRHYITEALDAVVRLEGAVIAALASTNPYRAITNGRIRRRQLELCAHAFASAPEGAARIVVAHHHFAPAPDYEGGEVMPKAQRALDFFARLRVDLVLCGHLHRAYIGNSLDMYAGADRDHGVLIVNCGTTTSRRGRAREREKNSCNWIEILEDSIRVVHYMYFGDLDGFAEVSRHLFPRAGRRYFRPAPEAAVPQAAVPAEPGLEPLLPR